MSMNIGGAETHVMELTKELHRRGFEVHVASNGGIYADELMAAGVPHFKVPLHNKRPFSVLRSYFKLAKIIRDNHYDIVHCHARIPAFVCALLHKKLGFRFVTTAHVDFKVNFLLRKISRWGECCLAVSNDIRAYLGKEYGIDPGLVTVTVNGIDMDRFSAQVDFSPVLREFRLERERRRVVYISRIDKDRSAPAFHLVSVAPALRRDFPDLDFIIVGGGNDFERLQQAAAAANQAAADRDHPLVTLAGSRSDINLFTAAADIFVGVSRSALEAMSAGCPVIVSGNQGYLGIFDETKLAMAEETNFCCRGCVLPSAPLLERDLRTLLTLSPADLEAQGRYNQDLIAAKYSAGRMAGDYLWVYDHLPPARIFRHSDVVISGYYGYGNSGDDTILCSMIQGLRKEDPNIKIVALTRHTGAMTKLYGVKCVNRFNPFNVYRTLHHSRQLLFGGGTLLQDSTSTQSLQYYLAILWLAKLTNTEIYVYANGIGPLKRPYNRKRVTKELAHAASITVREPDSKEELVRLGVPLGRVQVTADPVFLYEESREKRKAVRERYLEPGKKYFGISLRECRWLTSSGFQSGRMEQEIAGALVQIREKYGFIPVFLPMQARNDNAICQRISHDIGGELVFAHSLNNEDIISLIGGMEFVIGMRLHSLIFAAKKGVPMIGLAYDPKINGFTRYIDEYTSSFELAEITAEKLAAAVDALLAHYDEHTRRLGLASEAMQNRAKAEITAVVAAYRGRDYK